MTAKIFDRMESVPTRVHYYDTIGRARASLGVEPVAIPGPVESRIIDGWEMTLLIRKPFRCNRAQLPMAEESAKRAIAQFLFADITAELDQLMGCLIGGDRYGAIDAVERIREAIKP